MLFLVGIITILVAASGAGGKVTRRTKEITQLPDLNAISKLQIGIPSTFRFADPQGTVVTDVAQRNSDDAVKQSLATNNWKGTVTFQMRLASVTSNQLGTFPTGRSAIAIVNVNLFPTEAGAARFTVDSANDLESRGNKRIGVLPGVPNSVVLQGTLPSQDPTHPGDIITTFFHAAVGPSTVQASFTCIGCPLGQIGSDQTDVFTPFLNAITPLLPPPGSSIEEHTSVNVALVALGVLMSFGGLAVAVRSMIRQRGRRPATRASVRRR